MVRRAGLGVQQHADGRRAPLRLGLGTTQDPVRTSLAAANRFEALESCKKSVG